MGQGKLEDNRCVWMQAGVLRYKLCSLDYACENCSLDKELKGHYERTTRDRSELSYPEVDSFNFEEIIGDLSLYHRYDYHLIRLLYDWFTSIRYSTEVSYRPSHLWLYGKQDRTLRIGLDDFIGKCLDPVENIVFSLEDGCVSEGAPLCWLFLDDWNLSLSSPVEGRITAINLPALQQNPRYLQNDPYRRGWLVEIEPGNFSPDENGINAHGDIKQWYKESLQEVFYGISGFDGPVRAIAGPTMADGGVAIAGLRQLLGRQEYIRLVKRLLRPRPAEV
ncbi:hypothetical protein ACFL5K_04210 [Gemmatimonadota bacterium]